MKRIASVTVTALFIVGLTPAQVFATDPPVVPPVSVTTLEDHTKTITLSATDPDGGLIDHFDIQVPPTFGALGSISSPDCVSDAPACTATVDYMPDADYNGSDSFDFTATDFDPDSSSPVTASITITPQNDPPTAFPDSKTIDEDANTTSIDVLANDTALPDTGETLDGHGRLEPGEGHRGNRIGRRRRQLHPRPGRERARQLHLHRQRWERQDRSRHGLDDASTP